jgi:predicted RNase H-like nuclease (RuvC/YqgF family)
MENDPPKRITIDQLAGMMANGFAEMRDQFATLETHIGDVEVKLGNRIERLDTRMGSVERGLENLSYKVDQLDAKLDEHRQETKDGFAGVHRLIGGLSHTLADHEERIKELEGE